jgi:Histidine phosphatase superfamily (branch 1)
MERMWQERADYGHFFYRIPNGESAADAYDRISGFNESLWRQFGDDTFPSVCILVTHGLMTRVFLMKWFKYSVEYFENLRNIRHCEFVIMEQNAQSSYELKSVLRTWSELQQNKNEASRPATPQPPARQWGGCVNGCNHKLNFPRRTPRVNTVESLQAVGSTEYDDHPIACQDAQNGIGEASASRATSVKKLSAKTVLHDFELNPADGGVALPHMHGLLAAGDGEQDEDDDDEDEDDDEDDREDEDEDGDEIDIAHHQLLHREPAPVVDEDSGDPDDAGGLARTNGSALFLAPLRRRIASEQALRAGRDGGGSTSGVASPAGLSDDGDGDYFGGAGGGVAVGQQDQQQQPWPAPRTMPGVSFPVDGAGPAGEAPSVALRNGKAAAPGANGSRVQHHACTACGRPFEGEETPATPAAAPVAVPADAPGEEGTARGDVY